MANRGAVIATSVCVLGVLTIAMAVAQAGGPGPVTPVTGATNTPSGSVAAAGSPPMVRRTRECYIHEMGVVNLELRGYPDASEEAFIVTAENSAPIYGTYINGGGGAVVLTTPAAPGQSFALNFNSCR